MQSIEFVGGMAELAASDVVVEAAFESLDLKREIFAELGARCRPDALLATNTSTLDVDAIAAVTARPQNVVGLHFFSPANVMRLLEIVRGAKTSPQTLANALGLAKKLKKVGVVSGNCDGFIGNRMLYPYRRETEFLIEEGASPQQVDGVLRTFGLAMGPFAMSDLAGLDVGWRIRKRKYGAKRPPGRYSTIADTLCEMGRFGQKTNAGYYRYEPGDRRPIPDPAVDEVIERSAREAGIVRRAIADDEIVKRAMYPLVNEAALILAEGIATRPSDIDVVYVNGYGFPAWRGGPLRWADSLGLRTVVDDMLAFERTHGEVWKPAPLLRELADRGESFGAWKGRGAAVHA
jgi:3-hydroxyacyl-CoA dehydrogenase